MVLNCQGKLLNLESPIVMGILNATPDSFFDGGKYLNIENALQHAETMIEEGAMIIDVGGMSSRPGSEIIGNKEEMNRVIPIIFELHRRHPDVIISIDTLKAKVAHSAIQAGASMINDISGGIFDPEIVDVAIENNTPYIMMHMQGQPKDMQANPKYEDVVKEVLDFFAVRCRALRSRGLKDIILDPGFGFGKTIEHNYTLLAGLSVFRILDCPIMVGLSRKSMIYKLLNTTASEALNGTTAAHMVALQEGVNILRVHDVAPAVEAIKIYQQICRKSNTV
jgi:dihydropteroate synthase